MLGVTTIAYGCFFIYLYRTSTHLPERTTNLRLVAKMTYLWWFWSRPSSSSSVLLIQNFPPLDWPLCLWMFVKSCTTRAFVVSPIQMLPGLVCNSVPPAHLLPIWRYLWCKCACSAFYPSMITRKDISLVIDQECNVSGTEVELHGNQKSPFFTSFACSIFQNVGANTHSSGYEPHVVSRRVLTQGHLVIVHF